MLTLSLTSTLLPSALSDAVPPKSAGLEPSGVGGTRRWKSTNLSGLVVVAERLALPPPPRRKSCALPGLPSSVYLLFFLWVIRGAGVCER